MATVTGFTAERMLEIENTTIVDGEVVGNDLILTTREGTPINAGNVRGPTGPQGIPGPVQSLNDQTGTLYSPRIFANKTALDLWVTAPRGAIAIISDDDSLWEKTSAGWYASTGPRIYGTTTELNSGWPNAPEGSTAKTVDSDVGWYKSPSGWNVDNGVRLFPNVTERNARWPTPPLGARAYTLDTNIEWVYAIVSGTTRWHAINAMKKMWSVANSAEMVIDNSEKVITSGTLDSIMPPGFYSCSLNWRTWVGTIAAMSLRRNGADYSSAPIQSWNGSDYDDHHLTGITTFNPGDTASAHGVTTIAAAVQGIRAWATLTLVWVGDFAV